MGSTRFKWFGRTARDRVAGAARKQYMRSATRLRTAAIEALETRALLSAVAGPDTYGYTAQEFSGTPTLLTPGQPGVFTILTGFDQKSVAVNLNNNAFTFFGAQYTGNSQLFVSTNGLITFGQAVSEWRNNDNLNVTPSSGPSPAAIAPLWDDWTTTLDSLYPDGQVLGRFDSASGGSTPDRLTIQWDAVHHSFPDSPDTATFQAVLSLNTSRDGEIQFNYVHLNTGDDETTEGRSATVGIRNSDPSPDPLIVSYNGSNTAVATGKSILITPASHAPTPPTVSAPNACGTEGSPVPLHITAALADQVRAETLAVQISGVPAYATLSAGTVGDDGVWSVPAEQLGSLTLTNPDNVVTDLTVTATATDSATGTSASNSAKLHLSVFNVAPTISNLTTTLDPVALGTAVTASAEFTDPGVRDTHTAYWDWGDNTPCTPVPLTEPGAGHSGTVSGSHTYAAPGTYTVHLVVCDKDGGEGIGVSKGFVVVYDPSAGFVTGGGWIDSPAGALAGPNPSPVGKGRFGFVSKYQNGTTAPTGQTQFTLNVANLSFHSTAYDWMVVTGGRADYHGAGTINGLAGYHFQLTAIDGGSTADGIDRVRLRIWCDATGSLVYDNGLGAVDDNGPGTALAGGSIVVHA